MGSHFHLSTFALTGQPSTETLKFQGSIFGQHVSILVDIGSSHNNIQPRMVQFLNLTPVPTMPFKVMVGNGEYISCTTICKGVPIQFQTHSFAIPLFILSIEGADVVLRLAWLQTLEPVHTDFSVPSFAFYHQDSIATCHLLSFTHIAPPTQSTTINQTNHRIQSELTQLLHEYARVFQTPTGLPPSRPHDHHIRLQPHSSPINVKPYRYLHHQKEAMTQMIKEMLTEGIIRPSTSLFSYPVLLVKKKDGSWRFCVDYRALNAITIKDKFPIPTIDELLDELGSVKIFSKIDLRLGYHQILLYPSDIEKKAFQTFDGHYEFLVMPFGLSNTPSFQSAMNDLLGPFLRNFFLVFFDDILVYSTSFTAHLRSILDLLLVNEFFAKRSKCIFGVECVTYLGHTISASGMQPDPEKVMAIIDWPVPLSFTGLHGFLGITGFYRRFLCHYARIAAPLTELLKDSKFTWTTPAQFTELKQHIVLETDASSMAVGAVLSQDHHPLAFFNKKLCTKMQSESVYVREMFAITKADTSPFHMLNGHQSPTTLDLLSFNTLLLPTVSTILQKHKTIVSIVKYHLHRARQRMKIEVDKHCRDVCFAVGDWVWVCLQPYRQTSVHRRTSQKLSKRFYGPFRICRHLGMVAYELELLVGSRIHPVFHVSKLRPFVGDDP
uniref:Retrovirus-related Pol polyprotein from transposon 17.6 n=1 Tax=Cajanus cajan TaxID=3821 RepID=A0A151UIJ3_CAJCA